MQQKVLITGPTEGIGKQAALELARKGLHVIVYSRNRQKGEKAQEEIIRIKGTQVDLCIADLYSQRKIRKFFEGIHAWYDGLDILINNAGVFQNEFVRTEDGIQATFAITRLAVFLLTRLLFGLVRKNGKIIETSSMIHTHDRDFDNLQGEKYSIAREAYSLSKLCSILFTYKFAGLMKVPEVTANCFPPGVIDTKLLCRAWGGGGSPVGEGASRAVYLTISSEVRAVTGKYFVKDQIDHEVGRGIVLDRGAGPPLRGQ